MATVLVLGATGATGSRVVAQLLERGERVRAVVRSKASVPEPVRANERFEAVEASVLDIPASDLAKHLDGVDRIVSCLGHNPTAKGIFGKPYYLCTEAIELVHKAILSTPADRKYKVVLMNTIGTPHPDGSDKTSAMQRAALKLLACCVPPVRDNNSALMYMHKQIGTKDPRIEWAVVRPDGLLEGDEVTEYEAMANPSTTLFNPGVVRRSNVAHLMAELLTNQATWDAWRFKFPVVLNKDQADKGKAK